MAKAFGFTPAWVSIVVNSDAFQTRLAARKDELVDPTLRLTLNERFNALVVRSLDPAQRNPSSGELRAERIPPTACRCRP